MSVRIQFDDTNSKCYTNLDFVSGHVTLTLPTDSTISAINVKLEGESRTRLAGPKSPHNERSDKKRTEIELHKLLYKVQTVFPTREVQQSSSNPQYTLLAGHYDYPFSFKFPFNNDCKNTSILKDLKVGGVNVQFGPDVNKHVKRALPPSLSGFPGEAEIKYYVKATVVRPKFYQENLRNLVDIKFLPIESPRPSGRHEETFARRKQQFQNHVQQKEKNGLSMKSSVSDNAEQGPPMFQVDARLPNPPIVTCNEPLPLRVLLQQLNETEAIVYLSMFQVELIGWTNVRAHDLNRTERGSWVLTSMANMNLALNNPSEKPQREFKIPSRLWDTIPLPSTVAPSFETCNISRRYELEVRVGLSLGASTGSRPELIVLPLLLEVQVYSGIAPPPQLLKAMASHEQQQHNSGPAFARPPEPNKHAALSEKPSTPTSESDLVPAQVGHYAAPQGSEFPEEAPPSYEDAMADDLAPVDGPRRDYDVPEEEQLPAFNPDSKTGGGLGRRISERLFSQNTPSGPRRTASSQAQTSPVPEENANNEEPAPELPPRAPTEKQ